MATKNKTRPSLIEAAQRRAFVLEQRRGGSTFREIAMSAVSQFGVDRLPKNYDERYACIDVMSELNRLHAMAAADAEALRELENIRLDRAQAGIWARVLAGDDAAIDRLIKIMKRRADLNGLDVPVKVDMTSKGEKLEGAQVHVFLPDNGRKDSG